MKRARWGFVVAAGVCAAVVACSDDYRGDEATPLPDRDAAGAPEDAGSEVAIDAAAPGRCSAYKAPSCDPASCEQRRLYASAGGYPFTIVSDAKSVFWVEQRAPGDAYNGTGVARILRTTRAGSDDASKAEILAVDQSRATALALAPPYLYWTTYDAEDGDFYGHIKRVETTCAAPCIPKDVTGGNPLKGKPFRQIVADGDGLLLLETSGPIYRWVPGLGAAEIGTLGYYASLVKTNEGTHGAGLQRSSVARIAPGGATLEDVFTVPPLDGGDPGLYLLATDCTTLFGMRTPTATLHRGKLGEAAVTTMTAVGPGASAIGLFDLAADTKWVYGAAPNAGGLFVVDPTSGVGLKVAPGNVFNLAVDDQGVYWGDHAGNGSLMMLVK